MNTVIKAKLESRNNREVVEKLIRGRNQLFGEAGGWVWITKAMTEAASVIIGLEQKLAECESRLSTEREALAEYKEILDAPSSYLPDDLEELKLRIESFNDWFDKKYGYGKYEKESEQE